VWSDHFVDSGGVRIAARDFGGEGAPVVLIHGHYGNVANFDKLGPALAEYCRVIAYDQRGHGWSEGGPVTIEHYVADLDAVTRAFGLTRPWLYGGSFGTLIALAAIQAGTTVAGVISEDGAAQDFASTQHEQPAPSDGPTIVTPEIYQQIVDGYAAAGPVGASSAARGAVRRADGSIEIRPCRADLYAKESAFLHVRVLDSYRKCAGRSLYLAAKTSESIALESTGVEIRRFDTGHWISAADPSGVASAVASFVGGRA
jgi:pimeloyl-ACP methyl ester carboxylesterase